MFAGHPGDELGGGYNNLLVMNPDGTGVRRLTRSDGDIEPSWSPDGTQVVFRRTTFGGGCPIAACSEIWIVNADGTNARRLTSVARSEAPDWSPDGGRIVFHQWNVPYDYDSESVDIYVMNVDGSDVRRLTDGSRTERRSRVVARRQAHRLLQGGRLRVRGLGHERRRKRAATPYEEGCVGAQSTVVAGRRRDRGDEAAPHGHHHRRHG